MPHADWDPEAPALLDDVSGALADVRSRCPVPYAENSGGYFAFTRYADILAGTRDPETYSSAGEQLIGELRRIPIELDPPEHTVYRRIMQPYFSAARLQVLEPRVRRFAAELLQPLIDRGRGDMAHAFTFPFPTRVLCATLNIPDADWTKLKLWAGETRAARTAGGDGRNQEFVTYAREMIAARRITPLDPADDLTSGLLAARVNGELLTDERILGILRLLLSAGHSSTTISLGILIAYLAEHVDVQSQLRREPESIPKAIEEILRYQTPVVANANPRIVTRDVTVRGRTLKPGDRVVLLWGSGNRDAEAFPDADECRIDRPPTRNLVFGHGAHMCIGAPVARQELRIALEELLGRTRRYVLDGPVTPGVVEQERIVNVLGALDDKIELNRRTNQTLEEIARAIFRAWLVDFLPVKAKVNGETSFPGMDQSVFERLSNGFEHGSNDLCPIGWHLQPISGAFYVNPERRIRPGTIATYLDMKNMPTASSSAIDWVDREFTGSGMRFSDGDTLVARITPCLENGKTAFVDFLNEGEVAWGSTEYVVLRPKPPFPLETAYLLAREDNFREFAVRHMSGTSGRQRFPAAALGGYHIAVPPPEVATAFADKIGPMFEAIKNNSREIRVLSATRDLLLRHLFANT